MLESDEEPLELDMTRDAALNEGSFELALDEGPVEPKLDEGVLEVADAELLELAVSELKLEE